MIDIKTDRLSLGDLLESDIDVIVRAFTNPKIIKGLVNVPKGFNEAMADQMIKTQFYFREKNIVYYFAVRLNNEMVGCVSLTIYGDGGGEIGYWIAEKHWGNGYATESANAVVQFAFNKLGMDKVCGQFTKDNGASKKVLSKLGMNEEKMLETSILYSLINQRR